MSARLQFVEALSSGLVPDVRGFWLSSSSRVISLRIKYQYYVNYCFELYNNGYITTIINDDIFYYRLSMCLAKHHTMMTWEAVVCLHAF
jgi:hypothetical protein